MREILKKIISSLAMSGTSKSKTFLAFCFCFMAGVGVFSWFDWPTHPYPAQAGISASAFVYYIFIFLFLLLFLAIIFWHEVFFRFCILALFFLLLGVYRFAATIPNCGDSGQLCFYDGKKVTLTGWVSDEPDVRIAEARYTVAVRNICEGVACRAARGKVLVKTRLYPEYQYGDKLKIECVLQKPETKDDSTFRYDKYLARYGIWSVCNNPKSSSIVASHSSSLRGRILWLKSNVQDHINRLWSDPESSFMAGLLYGSKSGLPPELTNNFNRTGVTHIIAVSGFNITIIAVMLMTVLIWAGLWRQQAYWVIVIMTILFVIFTGATASVVRAAVMGLLVITAQQIGRLSRLGNALIFTAAVMTFINPHVLVWDAGFQLSFLATIGLVYVAPVLERFVHLPQALKTPLLPTLSAIIATFPLILYQFGRLSLVAPLVNVLVLWIIPWLMLFGFVAITLSFIFFPLGQLVAWIAHFGLAYVMMLVEWFGSQSWAAAEFRMPWWGMLGMYAVLIWLVYRKNEKLKALCPK